MKHVLGAVPSRRLGQSFGLTALQAPMPKSKQVSLFATSGRKSTQPEVLILATGGIPLTIHFPGLEDTRWMLSTDLREGGVQMTPVEMLDQVGEDIDPLAKMMLKIELLKNDVKIQ